MRRRPQPPALALAAALLAGALLGACAAGGDDASPATTSADPPAAPADPEFCQALAGLALDAATLAEVEEALARIEATAPPELADEAREFVELAREASTALAPLGPTASQAEVLAVLDSLSPGAQAFVADISEAAATGELPPGPVGDIIGYQLLTCGDA